MLLCHMWPHDKPNQTKFGTDKMTVSDKFGCLSCMEPNSN